jgi:hypothetical protein
MLRKTETAPVYAMEAEEAVRANGFGMRQKEEVYMSCKNQSTGGGDDSLEVKDGHSPFDRSGTAWLLGNAVRYLNSADKEAEAEYQRVIEVLRSSGDLLKTVIGLFQHVKSGDAALRWNALHVLGDAGGDDAAEFLFQTAVGPLSDTGEDLGCETGRDMEILVCTMAVHALHRLAARHSEASEAILGIVKTRPAQPILIEAVKVAIELKLEERVRKLLAENDLWILSIGHRNTREVFVDPERADGKERSFTPPKSGALYTAPNAGCCKGKEN